MMLDKYNLIMSDCFYLYICKSKFNFASYWKLGKTTRYVRYRMMEHATTGFGYPIWLCRIQKTTQLHENVLSDLEEYALSITWEHRLSSHSTYDCLNGIGDECRLPFNLKRFNEIIQNYLSKKQIHYHICSDEEIVTEMTLIDKTMENHPSNLLINIKPRQYQKEAIHAINEQFSKSDKATLVLPCGCGKTLTSIMMLLNQHVYTCIVYVPSESLCTQWIDELKKYMPCVFSYKELSLITEPRFTIVSTYHSSKTINEWCGNNKIQFNIQINDEAHHLCYNSEQSIDGKRSFSHAHRTPSVKVLNLTATPIMSEKEDIIDQSDEVVFGPIVYKKDLSWAIANKYILDYKLIIMSTHSNQTFIERSLSCYTSYSKKNPDCKKTIIYCNTRQSADLLYTVFTEHTKDILILRVTSMEENITTSMTTDRQQRFVTADRAIIITVYKFGEGTDIPCVDSILFAEPMQADIRIVQSLLRANRKHGDQTHAVYIIPINWYDYVNGESQSEYKNVINIIKSLHIHGESDANISGKIVHTSICKNNTIIESKESSLFDAKLRIINGDLIRSGKLITLQEEFELCAEENATHHITNWDDYHSCPDLNWYNESPKDYFKSVWNNKLGVYGFFGMDTSIYPKNISAWKAVCKEAQITTPIMYQKKYKDFNLPQYPEELYPNFGNLVDRLSVTRIVRSFK